MQIYLISMLKNAKWQESTKLSYHLLLSQLLYNVNLMTLHITVIPFIYTLLYKWQHIHRNVMNAFFPFIVLGMDHIFVSNPTAEFVAKNIQRFMTVVITGFYLNRAYFIPLGNQKSISYK